MMTFYKIKQQYIKRMDKFLKRLGSVMVYMICIALFTTLHSCHTSKNAGNNHIRQIATAAKRLDMSIDYADNHALFIESAQWLGVPYRGGGRSKRGVDCSGLTKCIYKNVYDIELSPSSQLQLDRDINRRVRKKHLKQGDLVFFSERKSTRRISHVGIYLKDGKFIHASSKRGVRIDYLDDQYWRRRWIIGGRILK